MNKKLITDVIPALTVIILAVILRLLPHPPNFAPISAMALFGGVYLSKRYALIVPFIALFVSDIFLGFHSTMVFVYGSFILTGLIGVSLKNHKKPGYILGASLLSSILFFLITNFGVWLVTDFYPHNFAGLIQSYTEAIPFFRNTVLGDLFYTAVFFGGFELASKLIERKTYGRANLH